MKSIITISFILFSLQCFSQDSCKSILNKKPILDTLSVSFGERDMYELFAKKVFDTLSISRNNQDAIQVFEHRIKKLKLVIACIDEESMTEISNIILNFTLLTGIESESDGN